MNMNMAQLMAILSKMDKKDLEQGLNKMNQMLKNNDVNSIINQIKKDKQAFLSKAFENVSKTIMELKL